MVNCLLMMVKCSSMMVKWVYDHILISPSLTDISPSSTSILPSLAWSVPSFAHLTIIEKLHRLSRENTEKELLWLLCAENFKKQLRKKKYPQSRNPQKYLSMVARSLRGSIPPTTKQFCVFREDSTKYILFFSNYFKIEMHIFSVDVDVEKARILLAPL